MDREAELEKIIDDAERELAPIRRRAKALTWIDSEIQEVKERGITEEEVLAIVDAVYHPEGDDDV